MQSPQRAHNDKNVEGGGLLRARLPSIEDHAFIENRAPQPEGGVDAALGDAFTSQGHPNIGDDKALILSHVKAGEDETLSNEVDDVLNNTGCLHDFITSLSVGQLENALQRLEKLPRHLQEIKETGIDRPVQPEAGVDAALGAAYTSQGRSNIGDDAALVGASEAMNQTNSESQEEKTTLQSFGKALSDDELDELITELRDRLPIVGGEELSRVGSRGH